MARVELIPGIASISGKMGDMIFQTRKGRDGKRKITMRFAGHYDKKLNHWVKGYERTSPPSDNELNARDLFTRRQMEVTRRTHELKQQYDQALAAGLPTAGIWKSKQQIWAEVKEEITE